MRFSINQSSFLNGVQTVQRAISTKNVLPPILSGIYIEASGDNLVLRATDLEIGIECIVPASVHSEGSVVLPARHFVEIVRKLPEIDLLLEEVENGQIRIVYGNSEIQLNAYDADEFPTLQDFEEKMVLNINQQALINGIRNVSIAASTDYTRPIFTGVLFEVVGGEKVKLVATDTHRLAYTEIDLDGESTGESQSLIIPNRSLLELTKILGLQDESVRVVINDNKILFETEFIKITSRLIEGKFVNYRQVIPEGYTTQVRMLRKPFHDSLDRASLMSRDDLSKKKLNTVKLVLRESSMEISSKSSQIGTLEEEIPIHLEGEPLEIGFNAKYILDVLRVMDSEEIVMELTSSLSPGIIRPVQGDDRTLFLVLPIRLG